MDNWIETYQSGDILLETLILVSINNKYYHIYQDKYRTFGITPDKTEPHSMHHPNREIIPEKYKEYPVQAKKTILRESNRGT